MFMPEVFLMIGRFHTTMSPLDAKKCPPWYGQLLWYRLPSGGRIGCLETSKRILKSQGSSLFFHRYSTDKLQHEPNVLDEWHCHAIITLRKESSRHSERFSNLYILASLFGKICLRPSWKEQQKYRHQSIALPVSNKT